MFCFLLTLVALIAEDEEIKEMLATKGIQSQTVYEVAPIRILPAKCLVRLYSSLGGYLFYFIFTLMHQ